MKSTIAMRANPGVGELTVFGYIGNSLLEEGVTSRGIAEQLKSMRGVHSIHVSINSTGGSAFEGLGIYNTLRAHPAHKVVDIYGVAASAGSLIAMAGDDIRIAENAFLMLHETAFLTDGTSRDLANASGLLSKIDQACAVAYAERSGQPLGTIIEMMRAETWLGAAEAVELGFADRVSAPAAIAAKCELSNFCNVPPALLNHQNPIELWESQVAKLKALGLSHGQATLRVAKSQPGLRQAYVEAFNRKHRPSRLARR